MLYLTPCFKLACRCSPVKCRETSAVAVLRDEELLFVIIQGVFFNWSYPKNYKFFSVSKMFRTFKLVPP